jgi:hypothetical protein
MIMKIRHYFYLLSLFGILGFTWPFSWLFPLYYHNEKIGSPAWFLKETQLIKQEAQNINEKVLQLSLIAYSNAAKKGLLKNDLLTVIDYSKPSSEKRLWVFDLNKGKTLFNTWVAHGKNSGTLVANSFSNVPGSLKSSFGIFLTDKKPYMGGNGYSLRLYGLERGINHNAYNRDIVIHGAWYADGNIIKKYGQLGRSWGCPAVSETLAKSLIDTIKQNTLIFAYYPDKKWLKNSTFLASN